MPVKRLSVAKSRLGPYGDAARRELALAFAGDVVSACLSCPAVRTVLVVTDDELAMVELARLGARVVPDGPGAGLNAAVEHGALLAAASAGPGSLGVVSLSSDLPALQPPDLAAVLALVPSGRRAFVPDTEGHGTTLLAAGAGCALQPLYGDGSRTRHLASGAAELPGAPGLRRDVDTRDDLADAVRLGVGPRTSAVIATLPVLR